MDLNKTQKDQQIAGFQASFFFTKKTLKPTFFDAKSGSACYTLPSYYDSLNAENTEGAFGEVIPCMQPVLGP